MRAQDQLLPYVLQKLELPDEIKPGKLDVWARKSFRKIWDLSTYNEVLANRGYQEIFHGADIHSQQTYLEVNPLGLSSLTYHLSNAEIETSTQIY